MLKLEMPKYKEIEVISKLHPGSISFSQGAVKVGGTPALIKKHVAELMERDLADYYQPVAGIYPLREKLAATLSEIHRVSLLPEQVLVSHGAIGGITAICLSLLESGDEVLLPEPTYPSYRNIVLFSKARPVFVPAFDMQEGSWRFDPEALLASATSRTKMIILSNPSNPCGIGLSKEELSYLKCWCEQKGVYLLLDEVYDNYIYSGSFYSGTPFAKDSEFVIRTGSFSKDFAMSGWRIGFIVASEKQIVRFAAVQDGTLCCPSVIGQYAALYALEHKELIEETVNKVKEGLDLACRSLEPLVKEGVFSFVRPEAGIFLFIKTPYPDSEPIVRELLQQAKVALVPGKDFGESQETKSYVRLCFARTRSEIESGTQRILDFFSNKARKNAGQGLNIF